MKIGDARDRPWLSRATIGDALAGAARRAGKPLTADQLIAFAGVGRAASRRILEEVLVELEASVRLVVGWRQVTLLERIKVYSAPAEAARQWL